MVLISWHPFHFRQLIGLNLPYRKCFSGFIKVLETSTGAVLKHFRVKPARMRESWSGSWHS